ncbi:helix-turn-helix transcriptional regulator [Actinoplanes sp. NPDC049681]|uniref:helix-turn-helix transcriptional regulator n=1 Tax=Actinoplanes sp. NPDC049681 TaxID=3363905 RepID=UPI0037B7F458
MDDRPELGRFLQSRRARISPERAGLHVSARRRVQGLRREEVAQLADISVEYYVRLEQGRATRPSPEVLDALARALELDDVERAHLQDLTRTGAVKPRRSPQPERARPELVQLLGLMEKTPALLINYRMDVLAWNRLAAMLFFDFDAVSAKERNLARFAFLDPASGERWVDWADVAKATVGALRLAAGRYSDDEALATLLGELTMRSEAFRNLWAGRDVRERTHGQKRFRHPLVGELTLRFENFDLPGVAGQRLVAFSADPAGPAQAALDLIAMWNAPESARPATRES